MTKLEYSDTCRCGGKYLLTIESPDSVGDLRRFMNAWKEEHGSHDPERRSREMQAALARDRR